MLSNRQLHLRHLAQTNPFPLLFEVERAEGVYLYATDNRKYFDLISGISVSNIGHNHPVVTKAIRQQLEKYSHVMVYGEFVQKPQIEFAKLLTDNLPSSLNSVYFVNSGSEAVEGALKLAKRASGRHEIVYFRNSYHGSTSGALSVLGDEYFKSSFRPLIPGTRQLEYNDLNGLNEITKKTAAVILETVQAESGITIPAGDFLKQLRKKCDENGVLLILDEIQCGLGRSGELFAFYQFGIEPDILLLAKALGGGMPLGAFISNDKLMSNLASDPVLGHITTFGGHPVCCAAGKAAFEFLISNRIFEDVNSKSELFAEKINSRHIRSLRAIGLLIAVEFDDFETNKKVIDKCLENGLITDWFIFNDRSLRIAPPLVISDDEIVESCEILNRSIEEALS